MTVPPPKTRRLIVLRHAKSAWPEDVPDLDRPLGPRGRRDAPEAGRWLRAAGLLPDAVRCSPARRTRETWELVAAQWPLTPPVTYDRRVYGGDADALVEVVREVPDSVGAVLLIGHQPAMQELTLLLAGASGGEQQARLREKFPTCAIAVLDCPDPWRRLAAGTAELTHFEVPRAPR